MTWGSWLWSLPELVAATFAVAVGMSKWAEDHEHFRAWLMLSAMALVTIAILVAVRLIK